MINIDKYSLLIIAIIGIGPVYWFIGIDYSIFQAIKYLLLALLLSNCFRVATIEPSLDIRTFIFIFILLSLVCISSFNIFSELSQVFSALFPFIYILAISIVFKKSLLIRNIDIVVLGIASITFIYTFIFVIIVSALPNFPSQVSILPLKYTGFAFTRTGWSGTLSSFVVFSLYFLNVLKFSRKNKILILTTVFMVIYAQFISGGRGGLLTSLIALSIFVFYDFKSNFIKWLPIIAGFLFLIVSMYAKGDLDLILRVGNTADVTAGRFEQYLLSVELIFEKPLLGWGFNGYLEEFNENGIDVHVHNVWIGFLLQYGIVFFLIFVGFLTLNIVRVRTNYFRKMMVIVGLLPTIVEPSAIFVSISGYLSWWFVYSYETQSLDMEQNIT
ncbi:O-antigen ligase family protein [Vibrio breoganii]